MCTTLFILSSFRIVNAEIIGGFGYRDGDRGIGNIDLGTGVEDLFPRHIGGLASINQVSNFVFDVRAGNAIQILCNGFNRNNFRRTIRIINNCLLGWTTAPLCYPIPKVRMPLFTTGIPCAEDLCSLDPFRVPACQEVRLLLQSWGHTNLLLPVPKTPIQKDLDPNAFFP